MRARAVFAIDPAGVRQDALDVATNPHVRNPAAVFATRIDGRLRTGPPPTPGSRAEAWARQTGWQLEAEQARDELASRRLDKDEHRAVEMLIDKLREERTT